MEGEDDDTLCSGVRVGEGSVNFIDLLDIWDDVREDMVARSDLLSSIEETLC